MNYKTITLLGLLLTSLSVNAQAACTVAQKNEYLALNASFVFQQDSLKQTLLSNYCYDFDSFYKNNKVSPSIFFIRNENDLNIFRSARIPIDTYRAGRYQLDVLSYLLLQLNMKLNFTTQDKIDLLSIEKKYTTNLENSTFNIKPFIYTDYIQLLNSIASDYSKSYYLPLNTQNNTAISFSIIANEASILDKLVKANSNRQAVLYKKNSEGIAPYHLAFADKKPILGNKKNLSDVNNILINNLENVKINYLKIENVTFFEFVELFKENNIDFYEKLQNKYKFTISQERLAKLKELKPSLSKRINYVDNILAYEHN